MINGKNMNNIFNQKTKDDKDIFIKTNNNSKNIYMKPKERMYQYPQVINNYDVNVKVNIKKLNDNNINIENMNISDLLGKKLGYNNRRNKSILNEKKDYFSKTDNNIKFLDAIQVKQKAKKESLYSNMIQDLKNEFKEIKQKHEIAKENKNKISNKEKYNKNIRNYLFNENKMEINKAPYYNINKKYTWNNQSVNNSYNKKRNKNIIKETVTKDLITENNIIYNKMDNDNTNKNKTQNNFYKLPNNNHINFENEKTKTKEKAKNKEKMQKDNSQNLQNAIIYLNNEKTKNKYLNLTNDFLNNNINNDNSFINLRAENDCLNLTLKNNIKKKNSTTNMIKEGKIMENYISSSNKQKEVINKCNSYISKKNISLFNNTQKFVEKNVDIGNDIEKIEKNYKKIFVSKNVNNKNKLNSDHPKLLYLDRRINKIKNKMIIKDYNNNINHTEIKNNITIEKTISFSFIKNKINKINEMSDSNLNIINKIFKVQNNILLELKQKHFILKNELIKKYKEIKNYKNICFKLMYYIKDILFKNNNNKKFLIIQNQIIKENNILRKLFFNKPVNIDSKYYNNHVKYMSDINERKIFYNTFNKFKEKNNSEQTSDCGRMNTFENNDNNKKRNKSFERISDKYKTNPNSNNININNEFNFKYLNFREKKSKYIGDTNDNLNIKAGKKIKYLVKDKNNLSLSNENLDNNSSNNKKTSVSK
jgi:hypothetical protein